MVLAAGARFEKLHSIYSIRRSVELNSPQRGTVMARKRAVRGTEMGNKGLLDVTQGKKNRGYRQITKMMTAVGC